MESSCTVEELLEQAQRIADDIKKNHNQNNDQEIASAITCFNKAIDLSPENTTLQIKKAAFLYEVREFQACVDTTATLVQALEANPAAKREHIVTGLVLAGDSLSQQGLGDEAVRSHRKATTEALALLSQKTNLADEQAKQVMELQQKLQKADESLASSKAIPDNLKKQLVDQVQKTLRAEHMMQEKEGKLRIAENRIKSLETELENGLMEMEKFAEQAFTPKPDPAQAAKIASLQTDLQHANTKISTLQGNLTAQAAEFEKTKAGYATQISALEAEREELRAATNQPATSDALTQKLESEISRSQTLEKETESLKLRIRQLEQLASNAESSQRLALERQHSQGETVALKKQIEGLEMQLKGAVHEVEKMKAALAGSEAANHSLKLERDDLLQTTAKLQATTTQQHSEMELMRLQNMELAQQQQTLQKTIDDLRAQFKDEDGKAKESRLEQDRIARGEKRRSHIGPTQQDTPPATNGSARSGSSRVSAGGTKRFMQPTIAFAAYETSRVQDSLWAARKKEGSSAFMSMTTVCPKEED